MIADLFSVDKLRDEFTFSSVICFTKHLSAEFSLYRGLRLLR